MKSKRYLLPGILTLCILILGSILIAANAGSLFKAGRSDSSSGGVFSIPSGSSVESGSSGTAKEMRVYFFDVAQADAILIQLPNGKTIGIDAGEKDTQESLVKEIKALGVTKLDALVATHPHTDHIGGMAYLIGKLDVGKIYMTKASATTKTFEDLLLAITEKKIPVTEAKTGETLLLDPDVSIKILAPTTLSKDELNNDSVVLRITYRQTAFLFMGDAQTPVEAELLKRKENLTADVLKVGHHGSDTSSSVAFLKAVLPKFAVISVGKDNDYNHPSTNILARLADINAQVLRTDIQGTIVFSSDGMAVSLLKNK